MCYLQIASKEKRICLYTILPLMLLKKKLLYILLYINNDIQKYGCFN